MSVMGFQKKVCMEGHGGWVGGVSSIQVFFGFFEFAKPLSRVTGESVLGRGR